MILCGIWNISLLYNRAGITYITDNVPGRLSCLNRNCIPGEEVTFLDCLLKALPVQFLNRRQRKTCVVIIFINIKVSKNLNLDF